MTDERIEPTIDHEFELELAMEADRDSGTQMLALRVRSVREFTAFSYAISLTDRSAPSKGLYGMEIGGLSIPSVVPGDAGGARNAVRHQFPADGTYELSVARRSKKRTAQFVVRGGRVSAITNEAGDGFVRFSIAAP